MGSQGSGDSQLPSWELQPLLPPGSKHREEQTKLLPQPLSAEGLLFKSPFSPHPLCQRTLFLSRLFCERKPRSKSALFPGDFNCCCLRADRAGKGIFAQQLKEHF